ncbi:MAG: penicillin-binding protein 2 [candidate division KSB1 bacterium]|nr:penicillin-binding protein 2 [candidate division KSB1 bacterium]MDZ7391590.1 penicillin-binding protein 2 [candidate division KSB1 bacterium]MDZ7413275.1 penicillin-binding protein 2 [candidate division KSB1 bacterium]
MVPADVSRNRLFFRVALYVAFGALALRLFQLQVLSAEHYARESERNRIRAVPIEATRGLIYDVNGTVLVENHPAYSVSVIPAEVTGRDSVLSLLGEILGLSREELALRIQRNRSGSFIPAKIAHQISELALAQLEEYRLDLPGVIFEVEPHRSYPLSPLAPHALGYLGEISPAELSVLREAGYTMGDLVGKKGLEKQYDRLLRGKRGFLYVEVDALGREIRALERPAPAPPQEGQGLLTGIDADMQAALVQAMAGKKGGAVFLNCRNGEVLAIGSFPPFDLEELSGVLAPQTWAAILNHPEKPLFDRAVQGAYPAGSTFKLVIAAAALETKALSPEFAVTCHGSLRLGTRTFDCWKSGGHGHLRMLDAIEQSCNVYFYNVGLQVDVDTWARFAKAFGFGQPTGIDLPNESPGNIPDRAFLDARYGKDAWTRGMMLNLAVGQGDLLVTPLQMAQLAMAIANEGTFYRPHIVRGILEPSDRSVTWIRVEARHVGVVSRETYAVLKQGMWRVVQGTHGTGAACRLPGVEVAGKTGTAQNPHGDDHAWFVGFAPFAAPEVAFAVFVENGGKGGAVAAPVARRVLEVYFNKRMSPAEVAAAPVGSRSADSH